jgi:hypothetical protein
MTSLMGCELSAPKTKLSTADLPDKLPDLDDLEAEALSLLAKLFPKLSESERIEISTSLSLSDILALRNELEAARDAAVGFADSLVTTAKERAAQRKQDLASHNDGFPAGLEAVGKVCAYDVAMGRGEVRLSGVFDGKQSVALDVNAVNLSVDGSDVEFSLDCLQGGPTVDVVFLIDITGSMTNVIDSVRDSVVNFVDLLEASGIQGTVSVVSFQDSVGVNRTFQQTAPANDYERSPFFAPVSLSDASQIDAARAFVNRLEANRGADAPENLAGAIDFARNNVIGYAPDGTPNVIGDGKWDPAGTAPFPALTSDRQVFVALTDVSFHGDEQTERDSSLLPPFVPRNSADILASLHRAGTTVHVSDPSWVDESLEPTSETVDADYWAIHTGGVGADVVEGYSLVDLELVIVADRTGLLDITLDEIISSSCSLEFEAQLSASAEVTLSLEVAGKTFKAAVPVERY